MATSSRLPLVALIVAEVLVFGSIGTNFLTAGNALEVLRLSVEIGLLALALTPVIVSGGIDLSVGSQMGLSAVLFGKFWRDGGLPAPVAALATLIVGAVAGGLNGFFVTRLRIPPLIVTLGSFSLFRGLAEGLTRGVGQLHELPRRLPLPRPGLPAGRDPGAVAGLRGWSAVGILDPAPPLDDRPGAGRDRLLARGGAVRGPARSGGG